MTSESDVEAVPVSEPAANDAAAGGPLLNQEDLAQLGRGLLMGGADIIPGVSGGTVALILGIYGRLVTAISHFDLHLLQLLQQRELHKAARQIDFRFLAFLGVGIACGVVALGSVMHTLLEEQRQLTFAAFFGLIGASCYLVARLVKRWRPLEVSLALGGTVFAIWLVTRPALAQPPDSLLYIFFCGAVAICAMILPGISGAFILLILGKYHEVTGVIKEVLKLRISLDSVTLVATFAAGCGIGLILFSKVLKRLLATRGSETHAVLCGFMLGSLYKVWPFQMDTTPGVQEFKHKIFEHLPLSEMDWGGTTLATFGVMLLAAVLVLEIDRRSRRLRPRNAAEELPSEAR